MWQCCELYLLARLFIYLFIAILVFRFYHEISIETLECISDGKTVTVKWTDQNRYPWNNSVLIF